MRKHCKSCALSAVTRFKWLLRIHLNTFLGSYHAAMESEIVKCKREQVLVGNSGSVEREYKYLTALYSGTQFFLGQKPIQTQQVS